MKSYLLLLNWLLSLITLSVDTERTPIKIVLLLLLWFTLSTILLARADQQGKMEHLKNKFKLKKK
jgi:hypothetical protein